MGFLIRRPAARRVSQCNPKSLAGMPPKPPNLIFYSSESLQASGIEHGILDQRSVHTSEPPNEKRSAAEAVACKFQIPKYEFQIPPQIQNTNSKIQIPKSKFIFQIYRLPPPPPTSFRLEARVCGRYVKFEVWRLGKALGVVKYTIWGSRRLSE